MSTAEAITQDAPFEVHITPQSIYVRVIRQMDERQSLTLLNQLQKIQDDYGLTNLVFDLSEKGSVTLSMLHTLQRFGNESRRQGWSVRFIHNHPYG